MVAGSIILSAIAMAASCKLQKGEDTWAHYRSGGNFITGPLSFGADCQTLYFASPATGQGDIYSIDLKTRVKMRLTSTPECDISPHYLPESDRLLFNRESDQRRHIWSMATDGSDQQQITFGGYLDDLVEVSSNEKHILIRRSPLSLGLGRLVRLYLLSIESPETGPQQVGTSASFSPSGDEIVFNPVDAPQEIWIWSLSNDVKWRVGSGTSPVMSPDGKSILAIKLPESGDRQKNYDIVLIDVASGKEQDIGQGKFMRFVPDSSGIVFTVLKDDYSQDLFLATRDGTKQKKIDLPLRRVRLPVFCPDGSKCVVANELAGPPSKSQPAPHRAYLIDTNDWSHEVVDLAIPAD